MMQAVTETKCEPVYDWIKEQFEERLIFPTLREIADMGFDGVSSTSQANRRIIQMHELGWLEREQAGSTWKYRIKGAKVIYVESKGGDVIEN